MVKGMANISCNAFSSIAELDALVTAGKLNVTAAVESCPGICTLTWGTGNPDLSGVGANLSYIVQTALTLICGPLLGPIYIFRKELRLRRETKTQISTFQDSFTDISAQFSIPVAIAAFIRIFQQPSVYELAFLQALVLSQATGLFATISTSFLIEGSRAREPLRLNVIRLYFILQAGLTIIVTVAPGMLVSGNHADTATFSDLKTACRAFAQIFPATITFKTILIVYFIVLGVCILALLVIGIRRYFPKHVALHCNWIPSIPLHWRKWFYLATSVALSALAIVMLVDMERIRHRMSKASGSQFQDNQWGFGQVVSLFLWAPLLLQFLYYVYSKFTFYIFLSHMLNIVSGYLNLVSQGKHKLRSKKKVESSDDQRGAYEEAPV